jgi:hypothetical protein
MVIKMNLSSLTAAAAALAAALVAAAMPDLFVWAAFTPQAALRSSAALVFGVVMAWAVAIVVVTVPLSASLATAITAGIASIPDLPGVCSTNPKRRPSSETREVPGSEAPRIHHATRWRDSCMAACRSRSSGEDRPSAPPRTDEMCQVRTPLRDLTMCDSARVRPFRRAM